MDMTKCNCNPTTSTAHLGLNMCVGQVEIGGGSITQETTVIPTTKEQILVPGSGFDAFSKVIVAAVDNSIDANIIASNIREGVTILGITGTFKGMDYMIELFPPYIANGDSEFAQPVEYQLISETAKDGGEGYQVIMIEEEETDDGTVQKQKVAVAAQFPVVGIKQWNEVSQTWDWIYGSPEKSLTAFVANGTIIQEVEGKLYTYNIYENTSSYAIGEREVRFYTKLPTEV